MKTTKQKQVLAALMASVMVLGMAGCSDDKPAPAANGSTKNTVEETGDKSAKETYETFDVKPDTVVTEAERMKFEHDFTAQCVERELKDTAEAEKEAEEKRVSALCGCITKEVSKTLTDEEAEKFVGQHENPRSLGIKFENASFECMPEKATVKGFSKPVVTSAQPAAQ